MTGEFADTVVVGGGIIGATVAHLLRTGRPGQRIALVDQGGEQGTRHAASRRSLGVLSSWGATPRQRELLAGGLVRIERLDPDALLRRHLRRVPIVVAAHRRTLEALADATTGAPLLPAAPELVDAARAAWGSPRPVPGQAWAAVPGGVPVLDVAAAVDTLLTDLAAHGGRVLRGTPVTLVEPGAGHQRLTLADGRTLLARRTVLATGPWPGPEVRAAGGDPVRPSHPVSRGWRTKRVAALRLAVDPGPAAPLLYLPEDDLFLLPSADRAAGPAHAWASFRCGQWEAAAGPETEPEVTRATREGTALLAHRFPRLAAAADSCLTSVDGYAEDRTPLVELLAPGLVRAVAAAGGGARFGLGIAAEVRRLLAD